MSTKTQKIGEKIIGGIALLVIIVASFIFITKAVKANVGTVSTFSTTFLTDTSATLNGGVTGTGYGYFRLSPVDVPPIFCNEIYGSSMIAVEGHLPSSTASGDFVGGYFIGEVEGLAYDTLYSYCAVVSNKAQESPFSIPSTDIQYGEVVTFRTLPCATCPHTSITTKSASVEGGAATLKGNYRSTKQSYTSFEYREKRFAQIIDTNPWTETQEDSHNAQTYGQIEADISGLARSTQYEFRAKARTENPDETFYGQIKTFRTDNPIDLDFGDEDTGGDNGFSGACEDGQTGTPPNCQPAQTTCTDGQILNQSGECVPINCPSGQMFNLAGECVEVSCPDGTSGIYPDCSEDPNIDNSCPDGTTLIDNECVIVDSGTCETGQIGTYPNCWNLECSYGFTGNPPNCDYNNPHDNGGDFGDGNDFDGSGGFNGGSFGGFETPTWNPGDFGGGFGEWDGPFNSDEWIGTFNPSGIFVGNWFDGTSFEGGPFNGSWVGDNSLNDINFEGRDFDPSLGTWNGNTWTGVIPGQEGPFNGNWNIGNINGTYSGNCENGVCTFTVFDNNGNNISILNGVNGYGTWTSEDGTEGTIEGIAIPIVPGIGDTIIPNSDAIVRYHEGVETVFIRQIVKNIDFAKRYGYQLGDSVLDFAYKLAHYFGINFGYVDKNTLEEVRVVPPDVAAYQFWQTGNRLYVYEIFKEKLIHIRSLTTILKDKDTYEYYFQK